MVHELKILPEYFVAVRDGIKKFEVRKDDRPFEVGDILCLHEINCGVLTGRTIKAEVTYVLRHPDYCKEGYCILSIKVAQQQTVKHSRILDDYINREDILDIVSQYCPDDDGSCSKADVDLREMLDEIETLPTTDVQEKKYCKMIPLEPDCRGYTDVFICTNCHQHVHLGFIRKEYSGSFCLECGAEIMEQRSDNAKSIQESNLLETEVEGLFLNFEQDGDKE